ncbi:MAG: hypothetical protein GEV28_01920 [Actinophytocola sp.]|uniref:arylsulfotransferase family protein n=1 Tax=Actinophytocola sp. TaxID=1872138 RepID=UPI0013247BC2|nr:arylsulfotransferase family protein [Actinophytocola sp.]MPZ79208.1 hypothetical protein [Actinophytocola sp.]
MWRLAMILPLLLVLGGCVPGDAAPKSKPTTAPPLAEYVTRPDLTPPVVDITTSRAGMDPGDVVLLARIGDREDGETQGYALVVDASGEPVWTKRFDDDGTFPNDLAVQTYRGEPVLTYWHGSSPERGWGDGEYVVLDQSYRQVATVRAGNGQSADLHDMVITPRGTALLLCYPTVRGDESVREGVVQEVDIATGRVLFEWHSIDHVPVSDSAEPLPKDPKKPYDYFHVNSVDEDAAGDLLISARHTKAIYKISRRTGEVLWQLGGEHGDFTLDDGAEFAWQHDARWRPGGRISLLDNASNLDDQGSPSRALVLQVDERARTASLVSAFSSPDALTNGSQGSHQLLPSGDSFVGWGSRPSFTAFDPTGEVLLHGRLPDNTFSYRAKLAPWTGRPTTPPAVAGRAGDDGTTVHVSWNGATDVSRWRVLAGPSADRLGVTLEAPRTGFETEIELPDPAPFVAVEALDAAGRPLGRSIPTRTTTG